MDKQQATEQMRIEWHGKFALPPDKRWQGFTTTIAAYDTSEGKVATLEWIEQLKRQKPPCFINGMRFGFQSVRLVEETPTSGHVVSEYIRSETMMDEKSHLLVLSSNRGRYAIDEPEGMDIQRNMGITIKLGGMWIRGTVQHAKGEYFFEAEDGSCCGLTSGMRVRLV